MFGGTARILSQGVMGLFHQPQVVVQQAGPHTDVHYMCVGDKGINDPELRVTGELLVNQKFREVLGELGDVISLRAADCTLTDLTHVEFISSLPNLETIQLDRGTITNVALNALIGSCSELKGISLQGQDCRSGLASECLFEHPLIERPVPLPALKDRHLGLFDLRGYSSVSGILEFIKGAEIDRLVVTAKQMNLMQLDAALSQSNVHEMEFVSSGYESITPPESMADLPNLNNLPIRLLGQRVDRAELADLTAKLGCHLTVLDLANCDTLEAKDLDLVAAGCSKLDTLSLFECKLISSETSPCSDELVQSLTNIVTRTPVQHIVLGWDNDQGGPSYGCDPSPVDLVPAAKLQAHLSQAAQRNVKVTVPNWYPSSKLLDERHLDARM